MYALTLIRLCLLPSLACISFLGCSQPSHEPKIDSMANSILIIKPYKAHGTWVFDDERHGLVQEPFVAGIPEMIDRLTADIPDAGKGFRLTFAAAPFPGATNHFDLVRSESGGNWYRDATTNSEGWLCPALFHYFKAAPKRIYARADAIQS